MILGLLGQCDIIDAAVSLRVEISRSDFIINDISFCYT